MIFCPRRSQRLKKYEETPLGSGCLKTTNRISAPTEASELLLEELHEGSVGVTQEEDLCHTEPLPRDIDGQGCSRKSWDMLRSVTNAKGLPQIFISQKGSSTLYPVNVHSPSGAWIL